MDTALRKVGVKAPADALVLRYGVPSTAGAIEVVVITTKRAGIAASLIRLTSPFVTIAPRNGAVAILSTKFLAPDQNAVIDACLAKYRS